MSKHQQRIEEIKQLIEEATFVIKDFFLTQPPAPDRMHKAAYASWKARETHAEQSPGACIAPVSALTTWLPPNWRSSLSRVTAPPIIIMRAKNGKITMRTLPKLEDGTAERERRERKFAAETGTAVATTTSTATAVADNQSACDQYLNEIAPASIVGRLIKFKKGKFVIADDDTEIGEDEDFVCIADATMIGWVKFNKDGPPDRIMGPLYDGFIMPERETLGDLDPSLWEEGLDGKPADPWQHHIYLVLQKPTTQEFFTFVASTVTGRRSVGNLLRHYNRTRRIGSDDYPVIRLKLSGFNHRDERVGWVDTPAFAVVVKAPRDGSPVPPDTSLAADLDDEVPYNL